MDNKLKELQENLAKDLVKCEVREGITLTEENLEKISETYSKVYDIITEIKSL